MSIYRVVSGDIICDKCDAVIGKLTYDAKDGDFLADHVTVTCSECLQAGERTIPLVALVGGPLPNEGIPKGL